jgi:hypothetical protein
MTREKPVFILDVGSGSAFAFEAESPTEADKLTCEPWFTKALEAFCQSRLRTRTGLAPGRIRTATDAEAALYQDRATEFADASSHFLVAHLVKR